MIRVCYVPSLSLAELSINPVELVFYSNLPHPNPEVKTELIGFKKLILEYDLFEITDEINPFK